VSRLEDAEVFVAVVDAGSFTAAAAALGVTQPAVSRRVAALEARLGVRLLVRAKRLRPTEAGAAFHDRARRALGELEEGEHEASATSAELRGALRVTAPPAFARHVLTPHLAAFAARHPAIALDLMLAERRLDLAEEDVDLAIRIDDPGRAPGLIHTRLGELAVRPYAAPAYLAAHGTPRTPMDLARHACLLQTGPTRGSTWTFTINGASPDRVSVPVRGPLRSNDMESLAAAARAGMGVALLPDFLAAVPSAMRLRPLLSRCTPRRVPVFAVYGERRHFPARTRALLDFLLARMRARAPRA
jgi:DNA-binding transcriptional LysR family regulator